MVGGPLRAVVLARPMRWLWLRTGDFRRYQAEGRKPPRAIVIALADSTVTLYDAHFGAAQILMGNKLSVWAVWPTSSVAGDLQVSSFMGKLTLGLKDRPAEAFPFQVQMAGIYRGNREAAQLIVEVISPPEEVWWE